jgi:hypothetical protein
MTVVSRDPFARTEIRVEVLDSFETCAWCGNPRRGARMFRYRTESDGGRVSVHRGLFCSRTCHDSYHS